MISKCEGGYNPSAVADVAHDTYFETNRLLGVIRSDEALIATREQELQTLTMILAYIERKRAQIIEIKAQGRNDLCKDRNELSKMEDELKSILKSLAEYRRKLGAE
jgi:hypothetical protein